MMGWNESDWDPSTWVFMIMLMVALWTGLIALVFWLVRNVAWSQDAGRVPEASTAAADHVLAERFARGEIDEDEFKRRRSLLRSS